MVTIKRYPNRKLYNTNSKSYITLDGIAALIRDGSEVEILDHGTGEDLTTVTLTQIIFEQEKKHAGFLPRSVLTGLVQSGGETLASLRRTLASPLDLLHHVDQEITRRLQILVERGELEANESHEMRRMLLSVDPKSNEGAVLTEKELSRILEDQGIPTRDEFNRLNSQLDDLMAKLDQLKSREEQRG
ncbi:MAG: polyhydroxyalkanoate synthesis regulator DNA-binding domain-containing protein [Candidatus Promineifilaceae bacterium]|jgi:polyhydroxyalkanoate synthesis repressor PhaR